MNSTLSTFNTMTEVPWARHRAPNCSPGAGAMAAHCSGCVFTVCVCVCVCVHYSLLCVLHLDGLNAEHQFRVWVTILDNTSHLFIYYLKIPFTLLLKKKVLSELSLQCTWIDLLVYHFHYCHSGLISQTTSVIHGTSLISSLCWAVFLKLW